MILVNEAAETAEQFVASIQAHALMEMGFESHINGYDDIRLARIASQLPPALRQNLIDAITRRRHEP